ERRGEDGGHRGIYRRVGGGGDALALTEGRRPVWSPDGTFLYFQHRGPKGNGIYLVSAFGGGERRLISFGGAALFDMALSPDGASLVFGLRRKPGEASRLFLLSLPTMKLRPLTHPPPTVPGDGDPAFSGDGKQVAFLRVLDFGGAVGVWTVPVAEGKEWPVLESLRKITDVAWLPGTGELLLAAFAGGTHRLARVPAAGGELTVLSAGEGALDFDVSGISGRWVYSRWTSDLGLRRWLPSSGKVETLPSTDSTFAELAPAVSPGGDRLAFVSGRSGDLEIWTAQVGGGGLLQLTHLGGPWVGHASWSPDGRTVVFVTGPSGSLDVWAVASDGGAAHELVGGPHQETSPLLSPDGRWLYFASDRDGRWRIWRLALGASGGASGVPDAVTPGEGASPHLSPDGLWLTYGKPAKPGIFRVASGGGEEECLTSRPAA
ncbi:MAG: PD40 domain-containing protein, partial [Acidobacteria bacterium]|nr:PD40 domain-containing protein [Acidobacteriota bacterium]